MKLPKVYEPSAYEADIYALWEKAQAFQPSKAGKSFSVVVPPPNANGNLHIGHALTLGLEDIAVRYHRMKGESALLLPGADHAGFETQAVYEKVLAKEGKSRFDFTREELYADIWKFVAQNRENYENQFRRLGAGVDWSRFTFTLDEKIVKRAYATFKKMWDEKLIYRGERLVNYCTHHRTGFADIEVVHEEAATPLYYMMYGPFELATTRPETKFGDTAVAVHPDDKRYKQWVNKVVTVEGVNGPFEVRVVADEMVDPTFGTGVVKITPAHSFDDWEVAQRHNLPAVRVINHDGTMNHHAGRFEGMTVLEARQAVVDALEEKGLLIKTDHEYRNRIGSCYKCGTVIEPMLMEQWFVNMEPLATRALETLEAGKITFHPDRKRTQLMAYLENLKDWNISRQIAWGIPIPAFQNVDDSDDWIYDERTDQEIIEVNGKTYRRDPDVFDTWFSSGSWPYATLDYPNDDFKKHYPLRLMETGFDILYPWVSRMIMLGLYITGDIPFKNVYLHGLVLDEHGQKMSKSKGNVVNPMDVVDEYGSDALRMGLIAGQTAGNNQPFGLPKVVSARNFCNKLWNIARYIEDKLPKAGETRGEPELKTDADHWIMSKLAAASTSMAGDLENYHFAEAYDRLYHFVWDDFADWYLEASKATENLPLLLHALENILKIAHPFAPFLTETIWQTLHEDSAPLALERWPELSAGDPEASERFQAVIAIVTESRSVLKDLGLKTAALALNDTLGILEQNSEILKRLAHLSDITRSDRAEGIQLTGASVPAWLTIGADQALEYAEKLAVKEQAAAETIAHLKARLNNKRYVENAPEALVAQTKVQLEEAELRLKKIQADLVRFS
jgi:valyl-tRNA synthetase